MEIDQVMESPNWFFDYVLMDDISNVDFAAPPPPPTVVGFTWPSSPLTCSVSLPDLSSEMESSFIDSGGVKEAGSRKRLKSETNNVCGSKAEREKLRRDRMNERFIELGCIVESEQGRPPKTDRISILSEAVRTITQLRTETERLSGSNVDLLEKIKELKAEKNELRDEKLRLKAEKEKLEQQVKSTNGQPKYMPHPTAMRAALSAQEQASGNKLMPLVGYSGVAMWQYMPSSVVDTSRDHVLRPPVA